VLAGAAVAAALTVDEEKLAQSGQRFDVRCGEPQTVSRVLPQGAERLELLEPVAGQAVVDGFGDKRLATVQDVALGGCRSATRTSCSATSATGSS
jgi:hypothetical protein